MRWTPDDTEDRLDRDYECEPSLGRDRRRPRLTTRGAVRPLHERELDTDRSDYAVEADAYGELW